MLNSIITPLSISVPSTVFDANSLRLIIDTRSQSMSNFQKITLNLGISAQSLKDLLIDTSQSNSKGTNWVNYDLRSFQQQLGITSFSRYYHDIIFWICWNFSGSQL